MSRTCCFVVSIMIMAVSHPRSHADETDENEVAKAIRRLAPSAASMSKGDWEKLARSQAIPKVDDLMDQPLTLLFLTLGPIENPTDAENAEYRTVSPVPKPSELAAAFQPTRFHPVTPLQSSYIMRVTAQVDGDTASGEIGFEAKGVYSGRVAYSARQTDGKWKIVEFRLPVRKRKTSLDGAGLWKLGTLDGK